MKHETRPNLMIGPKSHDDSLLNDARERIHDEDAKNKESVKLARRLFIAMILITILGIGFYIVLPYYGIRLSPTVPILSFLAILIGTVLTAIEDERVRSENAPDTVDPDEGCCQSDGCATGMCGGPRPLQMFRDKKPPKG